LTEDGIAKMEQLLGVENIYTEAGFLEVHHIEQALKAHAIFKKDTDYVINDGEIVIVDEFTGRLMPGRRYSDGLHQAIEAKENVEVKQESRTLATITFQNYFRIFEKLGGMTGTAKTEEEEFYKIYGLDTIVIPTNRPITRTDKSDLIYKNRKGKFNAVVEAVKEYNEKGQPVLVGTISVETSEMLSKLLKMKGVKHEVLNAKHHEREAEIVAMAGQKNAVTIATNMAGRGTDIKLGEGVKELGGLVIIGTERHDSRRIDNQLRGRSGRQGDPGVSRFFVSMEDTLMRLFGADKIKNMMEKLGLPDDMPIENRLISRSIESAQKRVEGHNFDIRKHLLDYDDVMNKHREIIYTRRLKILENEDVKGQIEELMTHEAARLVASNASTSNRSDWDLPNLTDALNALLPHDAKKLSVQDFESLDEPDQMQELVEKTLKREHKHREESLPDPNLLRQVERSVLLRVVDTLWMEHIDEMTHLREAVALSGYGQRDPLIEYKQGAFQSFKQLLGGIQHNVINTLFKVTISVEAPRPVMPKPKLTPEKLPTNEGQIEDNLTDPHHDNEGAVAAVKMEDADIPTPSPTDEPTATENVTIVKKGGITKYVVGAEEPSAEPVGEVEKVGRNEPCPCGSGKKYKKCHGRA
jgi:preprotein translocase subunit SecA